MPTTNVQGINDFMSSLGAILGGPNAKDVAQASVMGAQRRNLDAAAGLDTVKTQQIQGYINSTQGAQDMLASGFDPRDPRQRAAFASKVIGMDGGLQNGPAATSGFSTFVDPNYVAPSDMATIMTGTGAVKDYASTPYGFGLDQQRQYQENTDNNAQKDTANARDNKTKLDVTGLEVGQKDTANVRDNAQKRDATTADNLTKIILGENSNRTDLAVQDKRGATDLQVQDKKNELAKKGINPDGTKEPLIPFSQTDEVDSAVRMAIVAGVQAKNPDMFGVDKIDPAKIPPEAITFVGQRAAELYQQTRNGVTSVNQAVQEYLASGQLEAAAGNDAFFNNYDTPATLKVKPPVASAAPVPAAPTPAPAPAPAPAPTGPRAIGPAPPGTPDGKRTFQGEPVIVKGGIVYADGW